MTKKNPDDSVREEQSGANEMAAELKMSHKRKTRKKLNLWKRLK